METQNILRPSREPSGPKTSPKDFFLYLGSIVTLYIGVVSVLTLLFEVIDQLFPRPFDYIDPYAGGVSFAISMLVVAFPLYMFFMRITSREELNSPEKRELSVRKWLVYLTLFIAGTVIAIDFVVLLQKFFAGEEITVAFVCKVVSIVIVLVAVFGYYFYDIRHQVAEGSGVRKRFAYFAAVFTVVSISVGFFVMGSPYTQKQKRFDSERVSNLQMIQSEIVSYWQSKQKLPAALENLNNPISGFTVPVDPSDKRPYEYAVKDNLSFELCAVFSMKSMSGVAVENFARPTSVYKDSISENWQHGVGRTCFSRTIDPEIYPPFVTTAKIAPIMR